MEQQTGTVKWLARPDAAGQPRRYGFIIPRDGGEDIFVHLNDVKDGALLKEGDRIAYTEEVVKDGRRKATHVRVIQP